MPIPIENYVGMLSPDDVPALLQHAWDAATSDQQLNFIESHKDEIKELIENLAD